MNLKPFCNRPRRRGSALVMAVAIVSVISVLGLAFFLASTNDVERSRAESQRAPAETLADGVLARVVQLIAADTDANTAGRYRAKASGAAGWLDYVDALDNRTDPHLASVEPDWDGNAAQWTFARVSDVLGTGGLGDANTVTANDSDLVDTDGGGEPSTGWGDADSPLINSGVVNYAGENYYLAVRVIDTSALLNLNVHGRPDGTSMPQTLRPVGVDLRGFLGTMLYDGTGGYFGIHPARYIGDLYQPGSEPTYSSFDTQFAQMLYATGFGTPFSAGEEAYLRWFGDPNEPRLGRLAALLTDGTGTAVLSDPNRQRLTTYSATNTVLRHPRSSTAAWPFHEFAQRIQPVVTYSDDRQALYERMLAVLRELDLGSGESARKHMAASFVSNLWAYTEHHDRADANYPWAFRPTNASGSAESWGVVAAIQRPVITEAFAVHKPDSNGFDDNYWGHAVEIWNPTGENLDLGDYRLYIGNREVPGVSGSLNAGQRRVFYGYGSGAGASKTTAAQIFNVSPIPSTWHVPGGDPNGRSEVNFFGASGNFPTVRLVEKLADGTLLPVDQFDVSGDLGYGVEDRDLDPAAMKSILRDDDSDRARYNVAAWYHTPDSNAIDPPVHGLGNASNLDANAVSADARYPVPLTSLGSSLNALQSFADLGEIYLCANRIDNVASPPSASNLEPFTINIADTAASQLFNAQRLSRGRLDAHPLDVTLGGDYTANGYPDVPVGSLLPEFFALLPGDTTREPNSVRQYGKVNVNTAPAAVLKRLLPTSTSTYMPDGLLISVGGTNLTVDPDMAVEYILAYRERRAVDTSDPPFLLDYSNRAAASGISGLRTNATAGGVRGFLTPGEVAVPLGDYVDSLIYDAAASGTRAEALAAARMESDYLRARDAIYRTVINHLTTRSDTYAVSIRVQLGNPAEAVWYYVALIDRGNMTSSADKPAVLLFTRVR